LAQVVLENVNPIVHILHSLFFLTDVVDLLFVLPPQLVNLALQLVALHSGLVDRHVEFGRFSAVLLVDLVVLLFLVFVEAPVGVRLVAASSLSCNLFLQIHNPFLQFALLYQQLSVYLRYLEATSDMLGI
jgi:hypothetical protein